MNIILTGYKLKDDISDDNSLKAKAAMKLLEKKFEKSSFEYKEKAEKISASLRELSEIEKSGRLLPDECAGLFGKILGEVFCIYDDEKGKALFEFGYSLGKFIYIIDACLDRDSDIRKKRYNPLIRFMKKDFRGILNLLMAECLEKYEVLNISVNKSLAENILLSGVWYKFEIRERKNK